jgi:lipid A oxidase
MRRTLALSFALLLAREARAETWLSFSLGTNWTADSDLHVRSDDGDDVTLHDVRWQTRSFDRPLYWDVRITRYFESAPSVGIEFDVVHDKAYAEGRRSYRVTGERAGGRVDAVEPFDRTFSNLEFSHGANAGLVHVVARPCRTRPCDAVIEPWVGVGFGVALPHTDATSGAGSISRYQFAGPVFDLLAGLRGPVYGHLAPRIEYRWVRQSLDVEVAAGDVATVLSTHHLAFGGGWRFGDP